jgi:hypothetical protein
VKPTMSGLHRAEACPASAHLPSVIDNRHHEYRERGNALHAYLATRDLSAVAEEYREEAAAIDLDVLDAVGQWRPEVAFVLDVETGAARVVGENIGRAYPKLESNEVAGTADLVGLTDDAVVVLDLKSGSGSLPPPREALQLLGLALAAARAYGRDSAIVGWLRLFNGKPVFQWEKLDGFDLSAALVRVRDVLRGVESADANATPVLGAHCRYCPAALRCPAQTSLLAALVGKGLTLDEADLPGVVERLDAAEMAVKAARALVDEMAKASPIRLPTGEVYGLVTGEKERLDVEKTRALLQAELPEAFEQEWSVSKSSVREALRKRTPKGITKAMEDMEERLRKAGAVRVDAFTAVRRFRPKAALTEGK